MDRKKSLSQITAESLRNAICIDKSLLPGEKLPNENTLTAEYGVSRATVREAIKLLVAEGFLMVRRGIGTFVAEELPDPAIEVPHLRQMRLEVRDLYEMRLMIEPFTAKLACQRASDEEIDRIARCAEEVWRLSRLGQDSSEADFQFHVALLRAAHNEVLLQFLPAIRQALTERSLMNIEQSILDDAHMDHDLVVRFLRERNGDAAYSAMYIHLSHILSAI